LRCIAGLKPQSPRHFAWQLTLLSLANLTVFLPQSDDWSYCVSRRILAHPPLWLQEYSTSPAVPYLWRSVLADVTTPEAGNFVELILLYHGGMSHHSQVTESSEYMSNFLKTYRVLLLFFALVLYLSRKGFLWPTYVFIWWCK
jgi:hypothetical protein